MAEAEASSNADFEEDRSDLDAELPEKPMSEGFNLPSGYAKHYDSISSDSVSFSTSGWLIDVLAIQHWLRLEATVALSTDAPQASAEHLFREMGVRSKESMVEAVDGAPRLTETGATKLAERLEAATDRKTLFENELEDGDRSRATRIWAEAWAGDLDSSESSGPINAEAKVWSISDFASKATRGKLNLSPSYQRGDVWPTGHCQQLIVSILRGIPLPSVILLKPKIGGNMGAYDVVDGKQRLTTILRFIGKHPEALRVVAEADDLQPDIGFKTLFETDYKSFRRAWTTHRSSQLNAKKEAESYFPFRLPKSNKLPSSELEGKFYTDIHDVYLEVGGESLTVKDLFEETVNYKIPLIEYSEASSKQIHEVFHLYNRQGKHLNAEEIRNALYHEVGMMRLLLSASGDNPDYDELAPDIPTKKRWKLGELASNLEAYGFGVARYRRTKVLSPLYSRVSSLGLSSAS